MLDAIAAAGIELDAGQSVVAGRLMALQAALSAWQPDNGWTLAGLFGKRGAGRPRGLYIHGKVGCGKSMLMDAFYDQATTEPRRRIHFHEFMAETHERIGKARAHADGDPIPLVAKQIAASARLLCFDEFHVTDIADAMILSRLFEGLWNAGAVVVATSNVAPDALYANGLNRQLFLPFIAMIERHMAVSELVSDTDYRMTKLAGRQLYFTPLGEAAHERMRQMFQTVTGRLHGEPVRIEVKGRWLEIPEATRGVASFNFADLCSKPLGALDYLHIARTCHTVLIENIPTLTPAQRNEARRFVNLIDTLYDNRVCLIASAAAEPGQLYTEGDGAVLFERTVSRLVEMRSEAYLADREARLANRAAADAQ